ncbi:MAG: serine hydrolase [Balneolaceae bacterium]|nr:serine hydrolase [Balneolaceae bacterium]MCH8547424.1 serine hydrolase [Balneolaceae bacterium]
MKLRTAPLSFAFVITLITLLMLSACRTTEPPAEERRPGLPTPPADDRELRTEQIPSDVDIDSLLAEMTLEEKVGQIFVVPAYGTFRNDRDPDYLRLKRLIRDYHIGGLIFMSGDIYGQAVLTNRYQEQSSVPLWISQDMEFGAAMRVRGTTRITPAMGIAATGDPHNAWLKGKITAREASALGVHQIFAPVLDVNNNPENPVINVRSFSASPQMVAEFGMQKVEGIESEGVLATAKHFPGHGDTDTDSHLALPVINHDYARLDSLELHPFRVSVSNGLRSVMSAHIAFPAISENIDMPATLDASVLNRVLRDTLGFDGLIVTDGLNMQGITDTFSPGDAVIRALNAGADMMLMSPDEMTAVNEVIRAVESGRISEERIEQSARKILQLKKEHGVFENHMVDLDALANRINTPDYQTIAERIARESVTLLKNENDVLPIREVDNLNILAVALADDRSGSTGSGFARELRNYHSNVNFHVLDQRTSEEEKERIVTAAENADLILIGSFIIVRSHQPMQVQPEQLALLRKLTSMDKPSGVIAFGNPYVVQDLPDADVHMMAWASTAHQISQTVPALFGASKISGKLPINIPGMYKIGDGIEIDQSVVRLDRPEAAGLSTDSLLHIDMIMQKAIDDSVFPGGVVGVMRDGALVWQNGYGYHDYTKTTQTAPNTVFDLASITKAMATTTSIMKLVDDGRISLDDPVYQYIEEFDEGEKRDVTIRHLLLHTSGLAAFRVYVDELQTRDEIVKAVRNEPLENTPGEEYVYSDLGFILLGEIVHEVTGTRLDRFARNHFFYPMGLSSTHFNPKRVGRWVSNRIPPTEIDVSFDRGTVQGDVHDERAFFMDGVAGHAGLFSTAREIASWSYMLLNGGKYGGHQYLSRETIDLFSGPRSPVNHRGYGFDRKSGSASTAGQLTGERTFGHLGFTGTSVWMDPDENIAIILLTNRTFPSREYGSDISRIRARIADAVMNSIEIHYSQTEEE